MRSAAHELSYDGTSTGDGLSGPTHPQTQGGTIASAMPFAATETIPPIPFAVKGLLASGGMARVYLCEDAHGERLAVKVLRPELATQLDLVARFLAEHEVACRIRHENIARVHDARLVDGVPYLVMELIEGESLSLLAERVRLAPGAVASVGAQVASALAHAHAARVLHCDVKPDNIIVVSEPGLAGWPRVKLIDFGVARFLGNPCIGEDAISGTPAYMAPEQWHGEATPASDIYALGCVLYELVGGRPPFVGNYSEIMAGHLYQPPVPPSTLRPGLPAALEAAILAMIAKAPRARPASMAMIAAHLADLTTEMPAGAQALLTGAAVANDDAWDDDDWATS